MELQKSMKAEVLEGVYLSIRDDEIFYPKVRELIGKYIKRSENIINIRGLLMDSVSEFDDKLRDTIKKYLSIISDNPQKLIIINKYAYDLVAKQLEEKTNKAIEFNKADNFIISAMDDSFLIDSYKLSRIVNEIFKKNYPNVDFMKGFHSKYEEKIIKERNKLAHAKKKTEIDDVFYFESKDGENTNYDSEKCSEIRKNINEYGNLVTEMIKYIK